MAKVIPKRVEMPRQKPEVRRHNFNEVALGFDMELARAEAERCLQCKKPTCIDGCPVRIDIPGFILKVREGDLPGAVEILKSANNLPAICGRVCPQETSVPWPRSMSRWPSGGWKGSSATGTWREGWPSPSFLRPQASGWR